MANQVIVVAILLIVQGVLEILMGLLLFFIAIVFVPMMAEEVARQQAGGRPGFGPGLPKDFEQLATPIYLAMGLIGLVVGGLHIVAGIRNLSYRGRAFGLVALFAGILSVGTCYCSLTALGLLIYGAIVYFNEQTARAFELGEQGISAAEIRERLQKGELFPQGERDDEGWRPPGA
jgi:hypothetical protein